MSKINDPSSKSDKSNSTEVKPDSRRKLLKSALIGGGAIGASTQLPSTWTKPITDSVSLPVHAATSNAAMDITTWWLGDSTWFNGSIDAPLDGTPFFTFSSGDNDLDVSTDSGSQDLSLFQINVGLSQAPGSSGTANLRVRSDSIEDVDQDISFDANQTDLDFGVDLTGTADSGGDVDIQVSVPGFETVRVTIDINEG